MKFQTQKKKKNCHILTWIVQVVTDDLRQSGFPDLLKLRFREPNDAVVSLIPEPVTLPQLTELQANDAGKGGAH